MGAPERVSRSPLNKASELKFRVHACMLGYACGYKLANDGQDTRALQHYLGTGTDGTRSAIRRWRAAGSTASGRTNGPVASDRGEDVRCGQTDHVGVLASQSKQRVEKSREFRTVRRRTLAYKRGRSGRSGRPTDGGAQAFGTRLQRGRGIYNDSRAGGSERVGPEGCSCGAWGRKTARRLSAFFRGASEQCPRDNYH